MALSSLKNRIGDLRRFRTVVTVLFDEGLSFFLAELRLSRIVPVWRRWLCVIGWGAKACRSAVLGEAPEPPQVRFRKAFERLGPTFVKLGQILSLRPDIVPAEYAHEFEKLQDAVPELMPGVAEKIVERELGQPIENLFSSFDERPLAAASLAQVHRAVLRDGTVVAVKVRRPRVEDVVQTDIHIIAYLANLFERHVPESRRFRPVRMAREFADWTLRELDFEVEGANIDRFRANFADDQTVVVPRVFWERTTKAVLTAELIEGVKVDDMEGLRRAHLDRKAVARAGLRAGLTQYFLHGFFHGDPHPGNFVALPPEKHHRDGSVRVGMFDFGIVGSLSEKDRLELVSCFLTFLNKDIDAYLGHVIDLAETVEDADLAGFSHEVRQILTGVLYKPNAKKSIAIAFYAVLLAGAKYGVIYPTDLVLLGKAFLTLESVGLRLYPEIDFDEEMRPFLLDVTKRELDPKRLLKNAQAATFDTLYFFKHLPEQTRALLERFEKGQFGVKIDLQELHDLKAEFDRQNDVRILAFLAVALLIGSAVALRIEQLPLFAGVSLGQLGFVTSVIIVIWLFLLVRKRPDR